ncbi:alpha/beta fold hydrolase [Halapricum sp. CBA1109]|uniref:alpha/beta fold hydrolase n=1 Tax=Halapricum sp. CBA1109 TaxID=2668068 RepID=UPI0012FB4E37|nr:alpha/beta fold hydrolase [Halapricum sp. CBA1109]MUV90597.1 alpha/beta fold hydrolase [Halapricum sp. CBA1109]
MGRLRGVLSRQGERAAVWLLVVAVVASSAALLYFGTPLHGTDSGVQSVTADDRLDVTETDGTYVLRPTEADSDTGLVFYPGGRVHPDAYLRTLAPLVREANVTVAVVRMPLNLAVFDQNAADEVIDRETAVDRWYVGGHSLGGAMACRYAGEHTDRVEGLVLFGSYCDRSVAETDLRVLSVTGDADTVIDRETLDANADNLPADATVRRLDGLNHSQFGDYRGQPGDRPSGTTYAVAHDRLANVTVPWFGNATVD